LDSNFAPTRTSLRVVHQTYWSDPPNPPSWGIPQTMALIGPFRAAEPAQFQVRRISSIAKFKDFSLALTNCCLSHSGLLHLQSLKVESLLNQALMFSPKCKKPPRIDEGEGEVKRRTPQVRPKPLLDDVANHDAFVTLLEVIDTARDRKRDLLLLLDEVNAHTSELQEPLSRDARAHVSWLRSNLDRTDVVLRSAMAYLQSLYSEAFLRSVGSSDEQDDMANRYKFIEKVAGVVGKDDIQSTLAHDWNATVVAQSEDIANLITSRITVPSRTMRPTFVQLDDQSTLDLTSRIAATTQLLCTLAYVVNVADTPFATEAYPALGIASDKVTANVFPRDEGFRSLYGEVMDARDDAVQELNEALDMLKTELELSKMQQSLAEDK
jgi:hypothetical protein